MEHTISKSKLCVAVVVGELESAKTVAKAIKERADAARQLLSCDKSDTNSMHRLTDRYNIATEKVIEILGL